jgi:hypothetical protein
MACALVGLVAGTAGASGIRIEMLLAGGGKEMILYDHIPLPDTVDLELWAFLGEGNPALPESLRTVNGKILSDFGGIPPIGAVGEGSVLPVEALVLGDLSATLVSPDWTALGSNDGTSQDIDGDTDDDIGQLPGGGPGSNLAARSVVAGGNVGNAFKLADVVFDITSGHPLDRTQKTEIAFGQGLVTETVLIGGVLTDVTYPDPAGVAEVTWTFEGFQPRQLSGLIQGLRTGGLTQGEFDERFQLGDPVLLCPAPEPVTMVGLAMGLGALGLKLRRRLS